MIKRCKYSFEECVSKLIEKIKLNAELFFVIDHKANAEKIGLTMNNASNIFRKS